MSRNIVYLQCTAGIAGDMTLAALIAAGADAGYVRDAAEAVAGRPVGFAVTPCRKSGISGLRLELDLPRDHHHRSMKQIEDMITTAARDNLIAGRVAQRALKIFQIMAVAEASVHGVEPEDVEFHEIGALDSIVDIVGVAAALESLQIDTVTASPLPMTAGMVATMHGSMPVPAPATVRILKGWRLYGQDAPGEFVTPTGAAICVALAGTASAWPRMTLVSDGFGFGNLEWPDGRPNCVRAAVGTTDDCDGEAFQAFQDGPSRTGETVFTIEANIDDSTPDQISRLAAALMEAGALDAWVCPVLMKKGRPGWVVSALCGACDVKRLSRVFFLESSTIGVRYRESGRFTLPRSFSTFSSSLGDVTVKTTTLDGEVMGRNPEADEVARLAATAGLSTAQARRRIEAEMELDGPLPGNTSENVPRP